MSNAARAKRFAADIWKKYQTDGNFQDVAETLGGAGVAAAGQAIFTDMSPEEIALSTLLGGAAAFAARKPMAHAGFAVGKHLDKRFPNAKDHLGMMSLSSPRGREIYKRILTDVGGTGCSADLNNASASASALAYARLNSLLEKRSELSPSDRTNSFFPPNACLRFSGIGRL